MAERKAMGLGYGAVCRILKHIRAKDVWGRSSKPFFFYFFSANDSEGDPAAHDETVPQGQVCQAHEEAAVDSKNGFGLPGPASNR